MFEAIIALGGILLLAIVIVIFRVHTLLGVVKGSDKKIVTKSNKVNAILFVLFLVFGFGWFFWYSYAEFDRYQLPIASEHGILTDNLFWVTTAITGIVFFLTHVLLFVFPYKYQYKENTKALFYPDNTKLEIAWTIVPAIVLSVLVFSGWKVWTEVTRQAPEEAQVIEIVGYQFAWIIRYPGQDQKLGEFDYRLIDATNAHGMDFSDRAAFDDFTASNIVVPKGKPVLLKIRARDVLHSVYIPHFRLKMDAVPGMPTRFWFTPNKTTQELRDEVGDPDFNIEIACAEVCGRGHNSMRKIVTVLEQDEYDEWYAKQESFLARNPEYLSNVPSNLKEVAVLAAGMESDDAEEDNKSLKGTF